MINKTRVLACAVRYLELTGCTIIDKNFQNKGNIIVFKDEDDVAICEVRYTTKGMPSHFDNMLRNDFEDLVWKFFAQPDAPVDIAIRYDTIDVVIVNEDRAIIRHGVNNEVCDE